MVAADSAVDGRGQRAVHGAGEVGQAFVEAADGAAAPEEVTLGEDAGGTEAECLRGGLSFLGFLLPPGQLVDIALDFGACSGEGFGVVVVAAAGRGEVGHAASS